MFGFFITKVILKRLCSSTNFTEAIAGLSALTMRNCWLKGCLGVLISKGGRKGPTGTDTNVGDSSWGDSKDRFKAKGDGWGTEVVEVRCS